MHPPAINKSPGRNKSGLKTSEPSLGNLGGNFLRLCSKAQLPPPPPLCLPLLMTMGSHQSGDGSPKIRGPEIPPRILLPDRGPPKPSGHLSLSR